jgi:tetratricopeptide (TPR) repeat protein
MPERQHNAKDIFLEALERPADERGRFLAEACGDDARLRQEVESLLTFHAPAPELPAQSEPEAFVSGQLFAGRYRMVERLGRGGMGDIWRADDVVLETAVALKIIGAASPDARERILNEVRLARQITHPAVCRVFDVGEADGVMFYSMELVRGEDLASLLRRVGRLPMEKAVEIGLQLCAGLAAAHAQGVLHRDLKPANILIDDDGFVRITDFGIAISRNHADRHAFTGTPAYMAPEQWVPGMPISERTDIYALGLVLYDLIVGSHPVYEPRKPTPPPLPSTVVASVDKRLERVMMAALSPDPKDRPSSVLEVASILSSVDARGRTPSSWARRKRAPAWVAASAFAAAIIVLVIGSSFVVSPGARTLTERDTIVLADFENSTNELVFDGTLKVALAVALEQSPFLKVFPDDRARETLRLMERSADERLTRSVAREIAQREQLKALLAGSISRLGNNYVIALEAINAQTGDVMAREQAEASSKEQVLTALSDAISRLRRKLGESLSSVEKFDVPLPRATTASLDALHAYSLALDEGRTAVPRLEAIPHLKRAIELDPTFAMAHALLSAVYYNANLRSLAPAHSQKAFELRDRVSDRERFFISWRYYRDAIGAWDKALELARTWTATYPREAFAFNSLGVAMLVLGQFDQSIQPFREAIRLDPLFSPAYTNLAASLLAMNQLDEARAILRQADDRKLSYIGVRRLSYYIAFIEGDAKTMERELEASIGVRQTNSAFGWQADTSAAEGRIKAAHEQYHRGIQLSLQGNFQEIAAQLSMEDAEMHAVVGQCSVARSEIAAAAKLSRDIITLERAARALGMCGASNEALALSSELAKRFPEATLTVHASVPVIEAVVALTRMQPARALELLEPVKLYDRAPSAEFWPNYLRGQAYLQLKDGQNAADQFRSIIEREGEVPSAILYPLAHLGLARAAALTNDRKTAVEASDQFFRRWKQPDPDLTLYSAARAEYGK